jgi:peroxiredoxin
VVVGINTGEQEADRAPIARAFRDKHGLTYPLWLDTDDKTMEHYGGEGFPTNAVVDREGNLRYAQSGFDEPAVRAVIDRLLGSR